ncbi:MAG: AAA family ATPase [Anaerolineae bacterium]|jgi:cytidylate kinase|nr:cytidylate kinase-like family protein [Chloroflexota bacterium]
MPVITMSRQIGSGGDQLAQRLCEELGLIAFDKRLMARVASEVGIATSEIVDYSETEYERRGFFDQLFRRSRPVAEFSMWVGSPSVGYERRARILDEYGAIDLIRATVTAAYERDNILIIGRGGQAILEGKPDVLHVRVVATFEDRVARLQEEQNMTPGQARRYLEESDESKVEYLRLFFNVTPSDASLYHLTVNTSKLSEDGAMDLIKSALAMIPKRDQGSNG